MKKNSEHKINSLYSSSKNKILPFLCCLLICILLFGNSLQGLNFTLRGNYSSLKNISNIMIALEAVEDGNYSLAENLLSSKSNVKAHFLILKGEKARLQKRYKNALWWYKQALLLEPEIGDPWYFQGLMLEENNNFDEALLLYEEALSANKFYRTDYSDILYRIGFIYQDKKEPQKALHLFDLALDENSFFNDKTKAAAYYERGIIYDQLGYDPKFAKGEYEKAVLLSPSHRWARLRYGYAIYWTTGDISAAEDEILSALQRWPKDPYRKWPYIFLGEIYKDSMMINQAIGAFEAALYEDPNDQYVIDCLQELR